MKKAQQRHSIFNKGKLFFLAFIFLSLNYSKIYAQNEKSLQIEIDNTPTEFDDSISELLEQQIGMYVSAYVYNSINTKSVVALSFSVDSLYVINSTYSENMPPLLKNEIVAIFKQWSELKAMKDDIEEKRILINRKYVIPIVFHFRYTSLDESVPTFKRDYVGIDKFLKNMDWNNAEMMDFIIIDKRNR